MNCMHENEVNKIPECNLLHDIINTSKHTKNLRSHYYPVLHGWTKTQKSIEKYKNFRILFDSGFSSTIVMGSLI